MSNEPNSKANKNILSRLNEVKQNTYFIPRHQNSFQCWGNYYYYYHNYDFDHYDLESVHVFMVIFDLWTLGKAFQVILQRYVLLKVKMLSKNAWELRGFYASFYFSLVLFGLVFMQCLKGVKSRTLQRREWTAKLPIPFKIIS